MNPSHIMLSVKSATFGCCSMLAKINCLYRPLWLSLCMCREIGTYDTGLVIVSLKATLGLPITQGQLYSRSILWDNRPKHNWLGIWGLKAETDINLKYDSEVETSCLDLTPKASSVAFGLWCLSCLSVDNLSYSHWRQKHTYKDKTEYETVIWEHLTTPNLNKSKVP